METVGENKSSYRVQIKNYPDTLIGDIKIENSKVVIKNNVNEYDSPDTNVLVVNTDKIVIDDKFMGLFCTRINDIVIIPLTVDTIMDLMDAMFEKPEREIQIYHLAEAKTEKAIFHVTIDELPELIQLSSDLDNHTVLLRKVPDEFKKGITYIEGKPGVGKSHYVTEMCNKFPEAIVYRFWVDSQDKNRKLRLQYSTFIEELGIKVYGTPKRVYEDELINTMKEADKLLFIDGLDHVENYMPLELDKFIAFIEKLNEIRTVVLSRPLRKKVNWKTTSLSDWSYEEQRIYLELEYNILDGDVQSKIYEMAGGYPIITYYLAEEYKQTNKIPERQLIAGVNEYYDSLFINGDSISFSISVFAVGNCFFTEKELESILDDPELLDGANKFIASHRYLFKIEANRMSLMHDSFNTYIRAKVTTYGYRKGKTLELIMTSLLSGSSEYMSRMKYIEFDEEFYQKILVKYADTENFRNLMLSTCDYNSIQDFYSELQLLLERRKGLFDIYQYYSFALLYEIAMRNSLDGCMNLVYQLLLYLRNHGGIEDNIFSSGYVWKTYLMCKNWEDTVEKYNSGKRINNTQLFDMVEAISDEAMFYDKIERKVSYEELCLKAQEREAYALTKKAALADYFVSIWQHGNEESKFYNEFNRFIIDENDIDEEMCEELIQLGFEKYSIDSGLLSARYQLHELGYFSNKNMFRQGKLEKLIRDNVKYRSFEVTNVAASYLKLANYEKREIDISSLAYVWSMYYEHKDASLLTIDEALIAFEATNQLSEELSFDILVRAMKQDDGQLKHAATDYTNKKGRNFVNKLISNQYFATVKHDIWFWDLESDLLDCFPREVVARELTELLSVYFQTKDIEYRDIINAMYSGYKNFVLSGIEYYGYTIISPDMNIIPLLKERNINFIGAAKEDNKEADVRISFNDGYIKKEDFSYIKEQNMDCLAVSQYADGWYLALPFVDVFDLYNPSDIKKNYLEIIHNAMFAKVSKGNYIAYWFNLIGNIPLLIYKYQIDIQWSKMYKIFNDILDLSLVYRGDKKTDK